MKKWSHFLFTVKDEETFSSEIKNAFPATVFIDGTRWETKNPPEKPTISECKSSIVSIWNKEIYPNLPYYQRKDGKFEGPQTTMTIQFIKSRFKDEVTLLSGDMAVGITVKTIQDEEMVNFVKQVWRILKKLTPKKLVQVNPETKEVMFKRSDIVVGNDAYQWCKEKENRFLKFNNNIHIYLKPL